jgi:predicted AlkP superfamily phosphohydrolase/phosphomutase
MHGKKRFRIGLGLGCLALALLGAAACERREARPLVVLLCVDGASPWIVDDLRAEGRLPAMDRLIRSGVWGPMQSLQSLQLTAPEPKKGYWSPVLWTSIATGMVPEKHGVLDFALPRPGTAFVWAGGTGSPPRAELTLPELPGGKPLRLRLRLRSYEANGPQPVQVLVNGALLGTAELQPGWQDHTLPLPAESRRPVRNRVELVFARQSSPSEADPGSQDRRKLAGALAAVEVMDAAGSVLLRFDPLYDRFALGKGFYVPEAKLVDAQSSHWRAPALWQRLGELGHRSGVVGYWATWPATEMRGVLVSSHMGLRGLKHESRLPHLTWPPELAAELVPLAPTEAELEELLGRLYPPGCRPARPDKLETFRQVLWQDEYYFRIARRLLAERRDGLFAVYLESIDVAGHNFLPLRDGWPLPEGCAEDARGIVDRTYEQVDRWVGSLLELLPEDAVVLLVADHGQVSVGDKGDHYPLGAFAAAGPGIRRGARLHAGSILDVAPTVMHLFGEPIPLEMDGRLLVQLFEPGWLAAHPPRHAEERGGWAQPEATPLTEASDEMMEKLRGIGYFE